MARKLTDEAKEAILSTPSLFAHVAELLEIRPNSLPQTLKRNSAGLTNYDVLLSISQALGKSTDDILEDQQDNEIDTTNVNNNSTQKVPPKKQLHK